MQLTRRRYVVPIAVAVLSTLTLAACSSGSSPSPAAGTSASPQPSVSGVAIKAGVGPICPLTGRIQGKNQLSTRAPLAVKIDNVSPALPQAGINRADIVVEELVEGGLTRLMAIFQCSSASKVGPIRSARISDADILALLHGSVLGYSGANPADIPPIVAHGDTVLISQDADSQFFYRDNSRAAPHNVFSSTRKMLGAGLAKRHNLTAPKPLFTYGPIDPAAKPAHHVSLTWPAASARWTWSKRGWLRTQNGSADRLTDGGQISTTNVVIMSVNIASTGLRDVLGNASPLDVTVGHNPVWVLRDGKMIKGTWKRPKVTSGLTLVDKQGHVIDLAPGRTWIELLPKPGKPSRH
jgi:Protein of unknown function (DUF3048) N-terminal domain/Protein of unknown function (DUF3048) C-terminal domain